VASVWTGKEMLVVGGTTLEPCGDTGTVDCAEPGRGDVVADGAAYDPSTDTWRTIAPAPVAFYGGNATWTGAMMVVLVPGVSGTQPSATLVYDPTSDAWRQLDPPPDPYLIGGAWDGRRLTYWQSEEGRDRGDWSLAPAHGTWTRIPDDPFPTTFDRFYVWTGDRYVWLGLLEQGGPSRVYQVATYDPRSKDWDVLPDSPVGFGDPRWFFHQGYVVNPFEDPRFEDDGPPMSGALDVVTGEWVTVPQAGRYSYDGCQIPPLGSAGRWLLGGGPTLVSFEPRATKVAPPCPALPDPTAGAWTGERVIIWGGPNEGGNGNAAEGLAWSPTQP